MFPKILKEKFSMKISFCYFIAQNKICEKSLNFDRNLNLSEAKTNNFNTIKRRKIIQNLNVLMIVKLIFQYLNQMF